MPFHVEPVDETRLGDENALHAWMRNTHKHLAWIPVEGFLANGASFHDDEYFGDAETMLRFNEDGIRAFCQRLGFRYDQLARLESSTLASQILNDLLRQSEIRAKLSDDEFVIDQARNKIIGVVSRSYVGYPNHEFVADIRKLLDKLPSGDGFTFDEAYGINSELTVRYTSAKHHGTIRGPGGEGTDRTNIGLEFKNSMDGTSPVRFSYFLHRLVCANGMTMPAGSWVNRVVHSGKRATFGVRLQKAFSEIMHRIGNISKQIETLGEIPFQPDKLALNDTTNRRIFDVVPGLKQEICERANLYLRYPADCTEIGRRKRKLEHDANVISRIPRDYGGQYSSRVFKSSYRSQATMFDFLNVFTEHAKNCPARQKLGIEARAGALASHIARHARMF